MQLRRLWPLGLVLAAMALLALSHRWALGPFETLRIPLPAAMDGALAMFRGGGRFIWPLTYVVMLLAILGALRALAPRRGVALLAAAALLQAVDTWPGWSRGHARFHLAAETWATPLRDPFWQQAAGRYAKIRSVMPVNQPGAWEALSYLALRQGLATDAVYLARMSPGALATLTTRAEALLAGGGWEADTLYVLDRRWVEQARATIDPAADLLTEIDGLYVLAPGWRQ